MFQSAPHFSSEANAPGPTRRSGAIRFQSAPHFSSEANLQHDSRSRPGRRFNPRLTSAARRTKYESVMSHAKRVSIRASLQQRGEHAGTWKLIAGPVFQSAPHFSSEANPGMEDQRRREQRFNPRLTSAARRTRWKVALELQFLGVSIRASLQQRGERINNLYIPQITLVSIRASLQQRGEPDRPLALPLRPLGSIRASLQQRGERAGAGAIVTGGAFQSAPHFSSEANSTWRF